MNLVYELTKSEKRVILAAFQQYSAVVQVIANCHDLTDVTLDPKFNGFLKIGEGE